MTALLGNPYLRQRRLEATSLWLTLVWAGLLIGVSFIATPVKFGAVSLTLPVALDVGRTTFHLLVTIEWILLAAYGLLLLARGLPLVHTAGGVVLAASLLIQTQWLLPLLDERVATLIAGGIPPPSSMHVVYIALEAANVIMLSVLAWASLRRIGISAAMSPNAGPPASTPRA